MTKSESNPNDQMTEWRQRANPLSHGFGHLVIGHSDFIRISSFGIRNSRGAGLSVYQHRPRFLDHGRGEGFLEVVAGLSRAG